MKYVIQAVAPETRSYETKYGAMISYKVKFVDSPQAVEIARKDTSPAPKAGDELEGSIDVSGQYGPKFKQEYTPKPGFGGGGKPAYSAKPQDTFTMYLAYAKDIAIAMLDKGKLDQAAYGEVLDAVSAGGRTLFEGRDGADTTTDSPVKATNEDLLKNIDDVFKEEQVWNEPA